MVSSLIHIIRGKQVILDSDLAMLYQVETGARELRIEAGLTQDELADAISVISE